MSQTLPSLSENVGMRLPGSFEGASELSDHTASDYDPLEHMGRAFGAGLNMLDHARSKTDKILSSAEKLAELMEAIDVEKVKVIISGAEKISARGQSFVEIVDEVIRYLKQPDQWLTYTVPLVLGVGVYLILKEQNATLVPALKALCVAAAAYFVIPEAQRLLDWFNHLSSFSFQGPEKLFGPKEDLLCDEDTFLGPIINKMIHAAYGVDISLKQVLHILSTVPRTLDGANRIWSLITALWSEIKLRVYALFGWEAKSGDLSVDRLVDSASDLVLQFKTDRVQFTHGLAMRIDELIRAHTLMVTKLAAENRSGLLSYVRASLDSLKKAQVEIQRRVGTGFTNRAEPVFIVFYGKPGQGKTTLSQEIERALIKADSTEVEWRAYLENGRNAVFTVPPGLKHWEGVSNSTKIVRIDELWAEREVPGMEASQSLLVQQLINTAPFTPPMAFEMKGMISLEPSFVIATTNANSLSVVKTLEAPGAITRRLHFLIEVEKDGEFTDRIDLTKIKMRMAEPDGSGAFRSESRYMTAPELVQEILEARRENIRKQRAGFVNADLQADYLLGLVKDPKQYAANLKADLEKKSEAAASISMPLDMKAEILDDLKKDDYPLDVNDMDDDGVEWHAFNTIPVKYVRRIYTHGGDSHCLSRVVGHFLVFCKVTGISWSFKKFLEFMERSSNWALFDLPARAYAIWLHAYSGDFIEEHTELPGLMSSLKKSLMDLPGKIATWIEKLIPSFVRRTDVLLTVGGMMLTAWYFSTEIKKLFYSEDLFEPHKGDYTPKSRNEKGINRDRKYLFRMAKPRDEPMTEPKTAEGDYGHYGAQMGERVPELARTTAHALRDNLYTATCSYIEGRVGFVLFVKEHLVLMPAHFAEIFDEIVKDHPDATLVIENGTGRHVTPLKQLLEQGAADLAREYFVTPWDVGRQHRDITVHFPNSAEINKFQVDFRNYMDLAVELDDVTYSGLKSSFHHTAELNFGPSGGERRKINSVLRVDNLRFKAGDCGALYIAISGPAAGKVVGMHVGGNAIFNQGVGIFLTKQGINEWFSNIVKGTISKFNEPRRVIMKDVLPVDRVSFTNAHCQYYGNEMVVPYGKTNVRITKEGIEARLSNYDKVKPTSYKIEHIHDVTRLIGAKLLANFSRGVRRYTLHEAIFGIPGEYSSIDMSTSAGFPLQGTPLDKSHWVNPDGTMNEPVLSQIREFVQNDLRAYASGVYPNHIFKIFPKDEKLPIFDVTNKNKVRTINGGPGLHITEQRMFFGDWVVQFEQNSLELNHLIGINMNSMDGDDLARRILQVSPTGENCFGGDISKFEFNQKYDIQMSIFDNVVAPTMTQMSDEERAIARMVWDHSAQSVHKWDDKLYIVNGSRASGEYLTSPGNSLYVLTAIIYSYYKAFDFNLSLLRTFFDNVYVVTMGDDNAGAVTDAVKDKFNQFAIRDGLADLGLTYTSPNKDEITEAFIKFDDLVMLQCTPRYDKGLGRYVWAQNLESILEIGQWTVKEKRKPNLNVWASNVLESLKKLCVHSAETWAEYAPKVKRMVEGRGVDIPTWDYRAMQAIVFGEDDLRVKYKFDYALTQPITFEAQSGRVRRPVALPKPPPVTTGKIFVRMSPWGTYTLLDPKFAEANINVAPVVLISGPVRVELDPAEAVAFWHDYFSQNVPNRPRPSWVARFGSGGKPKV